ncbi:MAG: two-component system histidine kinase PnpS [Nitrospirota bacterium]
MFRKILFIYLIASVLLLASLEFYLSSAVKKNYILNLKENLILQSRLIAERIPSSFNDLDGFCKKYKELTGARVTIIDDSGRVLGDSDELSKNMENHADRPEIREAAIGGIGSSIRFSRTLEKNLFYLAIGIDQDSRRRFVRLSMPLQDVEAAVNSLRMNILIVSVGVFFLIVTVGLVQTRKMTRLIREIASFSKEVAAGNFRRRLFLKQEGELGELGKNINEMAQELNTRLQQSEEEKQKIEAILKNMSDGLILTDTKGKIILSNTAFISLFGIASGVEGRTLAEILRKTELIDVIANVVESRERISLEVEISYPRELYVMTTAAPLMTKGEVSGVVLTFHDITRLKKLEQIRKDFVANVSHEIKTPITAIKGFTETLLEGAVNDEENARKFLKTIKNHSERLNSLVSDLLTLSRIELGDIKIEKADVDIGDVVDAVFATLKERSQVKGLYLKKQVESGLKVKADRNRLIQILLNLVDNGIKFTEKGGITIRVQSSWSGVKEKEGKSHPREFMEISVEDTGAGIAKKHLPRLGERFYRIDSARSRELGGTGLGLAIVKHLVKAHGWDMEIESEPGQGTKIKIICPSL